jgi:acetyl-CoA synthetase
MTGGPPPGYWRLRRTGAHQMFRKARDLLLDARGDHDRAYRCFRWPRLTEFNWALEWFDVIAAGNDRPALVLLDRDDAQVTSYARLAARSDTVAAWLRGLGVRRGDRLLLVLRQRLALWECLLAALKLGAVVIPAYPTLTEAEALDRVRRAGVRHVVCEADRVAPFARMDVLRTRIAVGAAVPGWTGYLADDAPAEFFLPAAPTPGADPAFGYFTSGTTALPKLIAHSHTSYPVGHLSSMYWNGFGPGDRHLNVSEPGWAKHSWSSFFAPFAAEATVLAVPNPVRAPELVELLRRHRADSCCAPPGVWRSIAACLDSGTRPPALREATSAGEPLPTAVAARIAQQWQVRVRDGYGQTETTALIGTTTGMPARPGWLGRPLPGYQISLRDPDTGEPGPTGEICVELDSPLGAPAGLAIGGPAAGYYRTGDLAQRDDDGWIRVLGRRDDVFKSFGHRVSPYEMEAVLLTHPAVGEAAVIPRAHPEAGAAAHAIVVPAAGRTGDSALAGALLDHIAAYFPEQLRARSIEFAQHLPRTTSGKLRRAALRPRH